MPMPFLNVQSHERRMLNRLKLQLNYGRRRYEKFKRLTNGHARFINLWERRTADRRRNSWLDAWWGDAKKNVVRDPYQKGYDLEAKGLL